MATSSLALPKPSSSFSPVGFGSPAVVVEENAHQRHEALRRRREQLETLFSPLVPAAALPSTTDRLVLWRNHHRRHHG